MKLEHHFDICTEFKKKWIVELWLDIFPCDFGFLGKNKVRFRQQYLIDKVEDYSAVDRFNEYTL